MLDSMRVEARMDFYDWKQVVQGVWGKPYHGRAQKAMAGVTEALSFSGGGQPDIKHCFTTPIFEEGIVAQNCVLQTSHMSPVLDFCSSINATPMPLIQ